MKSLAAAVLFAVVPAAAQLAAPNAAGVTLGHIHLTVKSVEAQTHFWAGIMGGKTVKSGMIQFPGVYIMLRQGDPSGPPAGSIVDHFGFVVRDMPGAIAKWQANDLKVEQTGVNPNQRYVTAPDGIRLEVFGDPNLPTPVQMNHIHLYPPTQDVPAMQAWYAKTLGGMPGKRESVARPGNFIDTDDFPGVNFSIAPSDTRRAPTEGRSLDHIGFEVKNLAEFKRKLQAQGVMLDKAGYLTDPWGTRIELTEGLATLQIN